MTHYYRTVAYHETDKMGIAHHSNYVKWMEEARVKYLDDAGASFQSIEAEGIVSPVAGVSVDYKVPCTFGDTLDIRPRISKYTGVKLEVEYTMTNTETGELCATATSRHAFVKDGRVCSLKKAVPWIHERIDRSIRLGSGSMDLHVADVSVDGESHEVAWLTPHIFDRFPWVVGGTSTRLGGVSEGVVGAMNFCVNEFEDEANIARNRAIFFEATGLDGARFTHSRQVHKTDIAVVEPADMALSVEGRSEKFGDVDGMVTNVPGAMLACYSADCVILSIVDPAHRAVGLVHAGWRGTVARIAKAALDAMAREYGTRPEDVYVAISPSICKDCFEVTSDVVDATAEGLGVSAPTDATAEGLPSTAIDAIVSPGRDEDHFQYDLWEANILVLEDAGVPRSQVEAPDVCTCCNNDLLFSHRATGGKRGTLMTYLGIL